MTRSLFQHRKFMLFWLARVAGMASNQMQMVAVGWQLYQLTGNVLDLGLVGLAQFLPTLLLALPAGHWVDRFDRRRVLLVALPVKALAVALLGVCALQDEPSRTLILLLVALIGAERAVEMPANASLLSSLVPTGLLSRAFALSSGGMQAAIVVGPALGGFIYLAGPEAAYFVSAVLYLVGAGLIAAIGGRHLSGMREPFGFASLFAGFHHLRRHPVVLGAITLDLCAVLIGGATALLPVFAADVLRVDSWGLGLLRSGQAVGALLAALLLAWRPPMQRVGRCLFGAVLVFGLATMGFAACTSLPMAMLALAVVGAADVIGTVLRQTLIQMDTPDAIRGRIGGINTLCVSASNQLGEFESGLSASLLGVVPAILLGGVGALAVAGLWMYLFPDLRQRDRMGSYL
ncbi:MFS transporter [Pseudomonas sp. LRF_L74]|uniref:MFS transporter n=1 Tax=Pseudomonas sp. LRF_L74 TaxID=3369422 RepID=UPI003F5D88D2